MGTRHLTMVTVNENLKVAQYGQWDGYPTGQGYDIADFIRENLRTKKGIAAFKKQLKKVRWATQDEIEQTWIASGAKKGQSMVGLDISKNHADNFPHLDRGTGSKILNLINDGKVDIVENSYSFLKDTLFCEYAYHLNFDTETVNVYAGTTKPVRRIAFKEFTREAMDALEKSLRGAA